MSPRHNDVWSDINNPNNSATMDDWSDCNNPNNSNYIEDDDYYEHGESCGCASFHSSQINYKDRTFEGFTGDLKKKDNGKWSVVISNGNESYDSGEYNSSNECVDDMVDTYPGCHIIEFTFEIQSMEEALEGQRFSSWLGCYVEIEKEDISIFEEINACNKAWREMRDLLAEENFNDLEDDIKYIGSKWEDWKTTNELQITEFCLATPEDRSLNDGWWGDEKKRRRAIFAVLQKYTDGLNLMIALRSLGIENCSSIDNGKGLMAVSSAFNILQKLPRLAEPKDIFSFDPLSPLEIAKMELGNQSLIFRKK